MYKGFGATGKNYVVLRIEPPKYICKISIIACEKRVMMDTIHNSLRHYIYVFGRTKVSIITTILATILAITFTLFFDFCLYKIGIYVNPIATVIIAICVTFIVTPIISWGFISLIIHVHLLEEEMRVLATHDPLTGLLSRREFLKRAEQGYKVAKREGSEFSLVIADFDYFKNINDQYGHLAGDKVLESFGKAVRTTFRESDIASRFGGDEFVFFLPNTSSEEAQYFTERLHRIIRDGVLDEDTRIFCSVSMGLAAYPEVAANKIEDVIRAADRVLYHAKNMGGNQTQIFRSKYEHNLVEELDDHIVYRLVL